MQTASMIVVQSSFSPSQPLRVSTRTPLARCERVDQNKLYYDRTERITDELV